MYNVYLIMKKKIKWSLQMQIKFDSDYAEIFLLLMF